jgi:nicotinamide-nucleotide amidase
MWFERPSQVPPKEGPAYTHRRLSEDSSESNFLVQQKNSTSKHIVQVTSPVGESRKGAAQIFVSMPGVPHEMKGLMRKEVLPRLQQYFRMPFILHQTFLTYGAGESVLAERIKNWEESLPSHIKLAYLPHYGNVRLRLTGISDDKNKLEQELEEQSRLLKPLIQEWLVIDADMTIQQVVAKLLKEKKQTVGTAESCTGGYIAHLLTIDAGASSNFKGTVVAYDNKVKEDILNVTSQTIESVGAVSEEVVKQMVKGTLEKLKTDFALATSGIMGPDGGSDQKPVGTVWIGVGNHKKIEAQLFHFRFDRLRNIEQTAHTALNVLRKFILKSRDQQE